MVKRVIVGVVLGWVMLEAGSRVGRALRGRTDAVSEPATWPLLLVLGVCVVAFMIVLLAHELGHLIGGRLVGFRAFLLIVGPLRFERGDTRWHLHLNTSLALAGGLAGTAPTDARNLRARSAVMVAAGPLASLIVGTAALGGWWFFRAHLGVQTVPGLLLIVTGAMSLAIGLSTLLPTTIGGLMSDGARLLRLRRHGPDADRDAALQALIGASLAGVRPRDLSPELISTCLVPADNSSTELVAWIFAQAHAYDFGRSTEAREWLQRLLPRIQELAPMSRAGMRLEAARQFALSGDLDEARAQIAAADGRPFSAYSRPLAMATLLAAEGDRDAARALVPQIRAALTRGLDRGGVKPLMEAVDAIERG